MEEISPPAVTFILLAILSTCKGQNENSCNVTPKDQYIEVGSDIEIVCHTSCVRGKISWTLDYLPIDKSWSNTINSLRTVLSLRNFTLPRATVQCHSADTQQIIGGTTIRTYSKPSKISCVLHYKDQSQQAVPQLFTCSWEHRINPSQETNYTVFVSLSHGQSEICNSNVATCTAQHIDSSGKIFLSKNNTVTVRAKTAAWEAYSKPYEFDAFHILKIIRPKLNIAVLSDLLLIEWKPTATGKASRCQLNYSKDFSDESQVKQLSVNIGPEENGKVNMTMESCSHYTFLARCALEKAPWSEWSQEETVLTQLNKSHIKLRLWIKVDELQENGVRKVHAMWTEIPATCRGTFTYTIKQIPCKENMTGVNYTDTLCSNSTCDVDVNPDAHRINLTVFHNKALLAEDSVYVPAVGESLPQVSEIRTSTTEGVLRVSWKAPVQPVRGYLIDWTHNGNQYYWKESEYTNTTLSDLLDKKPYNITVTPLFDDKTGHGTQALHVCSSVGDPDNVTIDRVQPNDRSAYVSWDTTSLGECSGAVINYTVFYSTLTDPMLNVTVDSTQKDVILKNLNPDTEYKLYVIATALTGSTKSNEGLFKTKRFDPRLITALFVSGSIAIILLLTLGLCCAVQWKRFGEKPLPNPGLSSLALWPSPSREKRDMYQAFSDPSESACDRVYTEETQTASTPPLTTGCIGHSASDQTEEYTDSSVALAPDIQDEKPDELVETQHRGSAGESTGLLSSENSQSNPYRSQSSVEAPAPWTSKKSKGVPETQQEKTAPVTVYVTLNMFEQGQGR